MPYHGLVAILTVIWVAIVVEAGVSDLTFLRLTWLPQHAGQATSTRRTMKTQSGEYKLVRSSSSLEFLASHGLVAHVSALGETIQASHTAGRRGMTSQSVTAPSAPSFMVAVPEASADALRLDLAGLFSVEETTIGEHLSEGLRSAIGTCRTGSAAANVSATFVYEPSVPSLPPLSDPSGRCQWHTVRSTNFPRDSTQHASAPYRRAVFANLCDCQQLIYSMAGRNGCRHVELTPSFTSQNHIATVTMQSSTDSSRPIWSHGLTGEGQLVGVGDTGLDHDSCYFRDDTQPVAHYPQLNYKHRKLLSYVPCFDGTNTDATDGASAHGTHVSGSVAGNSLVGGGSEASNGMAKNAKIIFHDLTMARSTDLVLPPDIGDYYGPTWAVGARISSNSWGGSASSSYSFTDKSSDMYLFEHQDLLSVFAAGNYATRGVIIPGSGKNILSIGAHDNSNTPSVREAVAGFSARGPTYDGRLKPDLMGPGAPVKSSRSDGNLNSKNCDTENKQGTSMATPLVSGSAALLRQYLAEGYYPTGSKVPANNISNPSGPLMKAMLIHSTTQFTGQNGPDGTRGFGRLELQHLFYFADGSNPNYVPLEFIDRAVIADGGTHEYCFTMNQASTSNAELVVTIVWHDSGAAAEGTKNMPIVNDIDLSIVSQEGRIWVGNKQNWQPSLPAWDHTNNVEQVRLPSSMWKGVVSKFKVLVHGNHIRDPGSFGGQPYSVVVSAPALARDSTGHSCATNTCPNKCSGIGQCVGGSCQCPATHHHVDCSLCNGTSVCNGRGECSIDKKCTCANAHIDADVDPSCGVCKAGWYGPMCDFDCNCARGTCDQAAGLCMCGNPSVPPGDVGVCYDGQRCDKCCRDHGGSGCDRRSFWCSNKLTRTINLTSSLRNGLIQVNGDSKYRNGDSCTWILNAVEPGHEDASIDILVDEYFQIETPYDYVKIYGPDGKQVAHLSGTLAKGSRLYRGVGPLRITFFADLEGDDKGFSLFFAAAIPLPATSRALPTTTTTTVPAVTSPTVPAVTSPTVTSPITPTEKTTHANTSPQTTAPTSLPELEALTCRDTPEYCTNVRDYPTCIVPSSSTSSKREYHCQCDSVNPSGCGDLETLNMIAKGSGMVAVQETVLLSATPGSSVRLVTVGDEGPFFTTSRVVWVFLLPFAVGVALSQLFNRKLVGADEDADDEDM